MAATPTLTRFLAELSRLLRQKDQNQISSYLVIEPPYSHIYNQLITELRSQYPKTGSDVEERLEVTCSQALPEAREGIDGGSSWTAFVKFMVQYLIFLKDVDVGNLLVTYGMLREVLQKANSALTHPTLGVLILPTVVSYSHMLARLAIGLDKQPHLIAHLIPSSDSADTGVRETLPERAANTIRQSFVTCLNDRSSGVNKETGQPEGNKRGIYLLANTCLKILFACQKIRGGAQIFENIYNQSPPLSAYPKAERVTYLYYLGRFLWANGHAYRALRVLEEAWRLCHPKALKQRRLILIFLVASNLVCGRFPAQQLLSRPEARGLETRFMPVCRAIRKGDMVQFRRLLSPGSDEHVWFSFWRIDLQIRNRCEVYVWRSLVRKTFLITGDPGNPEARKAPTLDLNNLLLLWQWQERQTATAGSAQSKTYIDPDFEGLDDIEAMDGEAYDQLDMIGVISRVSSLIHQELLNGYLSMKMQKFAIQGARQKGAVAAGFPNIWKLIQARSDGELPGWKQDAKPSSGFSRPRFGPGSVVNLSSARAVGAVG